MLELLGLKIGDGIANCITKLAIGLADNKKGGCLFLGFGEVELPTELKQLKEKNNC